MNKYILDREDTILCIVDIQERLVPVMEYGNRVIDNTLILLEASKNMNIPVIVTEQYPRGLGTTVDQILEELDPNIKRIEKISFSGYVNEMKDEIEKTNRKKIILVGMEAHVCVFQTVRDLLANSYEVFVPIDGIASRTTNNYKNAINLIESMGGVITNTETILFDLLKKAGTSEFKALSKLIK